MNIIKYNNYYEIWTLFSYNFKHYIAKLSNFTEIVTRQVTYIFNIS